MSDVSERQEMHDTDLLAVHDVRLTELLDSKESPIIEAVRRILQEAAESGQNYAAFGNTP